jgi:DNA-binding CsgD family transcriptional regulator
MWFSDRHVQREIQRLVAQHPTLGWQSLTDNERRIVSLVADGVTSREVGQQLHLSRHTVDSHLQHVSDKLQITSRTKLARLVGERGNESTPALRADAQVPNVVKATGVDRVPPRTLMSSIEANPAASG